MKKKLIFLDGDGTLWYPKSTKHTVAPHWIYEDPKLGKSYLDHMQLIPGTVATLKKLKKQGIKLVVVSTHPFKLAKATRVLNEKIAYFKLGSVLHAWHPSEVNENGKAAVFKRVLSEEGLPKSAALHVGDSYSYDYKAARSAGIDCLLFDSSYLSRMPRNKKILITSLSDVLRTI